MGREDLPAVSEAGVADVDDGDVEVEVLVEVLSPFSALVTMLDTATVADVLVTVTGL